MAERQFIGKVALITGGGSGIGRASALAFAAQGATVAIGDLNEDAGQAVVAEIIATGGRAIFQRLDATVEDEVAGLIDRVVKDLGGLNLALNNVGRGELGKTIVTTTSEKWDWIMDMSLKSTWLAMKCEIPVMAAAGGGAIVNTASIAGVTPLLTASPAYAAAKAGVIHLTRYAAKAHAADNIRINSVSPGFTLTPTVLAWFAPDDRVEQVQGQFIQRSVEPEEVAATVIYLCSDGASMITGSNVPVAGGTPY